MVDEMQFYFNPATAKKSDYDELNSLLNKVINTYKNKAVMPSEIAENIICMSNMLYIYGIFTAKLEEEVALIKLEADKKEAKSIYEHRRQWIGSKGEKAPAMSYFESKAKDDVTDLREKQYRQEGYLLAFKSSYKSVENKMNAFKKLLDAMGKEEI